MKFEDALKEMRKGKILTHKGRLLPIAMKDGKIYEISDGDPFFYLDFMNVENILREDWKEWEED